MPRGRLPHRRGTHFAYGASPEIRRLPLGVPAFARLLRLTGLSAINLDVDRAFPLPGLSKVIPTRALNEIMRAETFRCSIPGG
jgi:hypothetical protein